MFDEPEKELFLLEGEGNLRLFDNLVFNICQRATTDAYQEGRREVLNNGVMDISGAQLSAILDSNVCEYCHAKDGITVELASGEGKAFYDNNQPPFHPYCRCEWVYIGADEPFKPDENPNQAFLKNFLKYRPDLKDNEDALNQELLRRGEFDLVPEDDYPDAVEDEHEAVELSFFASVDAALSRIWSKNK
jgi:hypothetical protein